MRLTIREIDSRAIVRRSFQRRTEWYAVERDGRVQPLAAPPPLWRQSRPLTAFGPYSAGILSLLPRKR